MNELSHKIGEDEPPFAIASSFGLPPPASSPIPYLNPLPPASLSHSPPSLITPSPSSATSRAHPTPSTIALSPTSSSSPPISLSSSSSPATSPSYPLSASAIVAGRRLHHEISDENLVSLNQNKQKGIKKSKNQNKSEQIKTNQKQIKIKNQKIRYQNFDRLKD